VGILVERPGDVEGALREALSLKDRTVFLDFITDPEENVYPMIPAGGGHNEMILAGRDQMVSKHEKGMVLV
jgi:acetolactate synthase-1/2/3 large subunit